GPHQPVELQERLVVERDPVEVGGLDPGAVEAVADGVPREVRVVLLAREALLLRRGDDLAVPQEAGGGVVVVRRDAENVGRHAWQGVADAPGSDTIPRAIGKPSEPPANSS